jgi:hypothetical protein
MKWQPVMFEGKRLQSVVRCGEDDILVGVNNKEWHDADKHGLIWIFEVQVGRGKGSYKTRYSFQGVSAVNNSRALLYYSSLNIDTQAGYKKRLVSRGVLSGEKKIIARCI